MLPASPGCPRLGAGRLFVFVLSLLVGVCWAPPRFLPAKVQADLSTDTVDAATLLGRLAYISHGDVWLLDRGSRPRQLTADGDFSSVRWTPAGTALIAGRGDGRQVIAVDGGSVAAPVPTDGAWSPDDRAVAVQTADGRVSVVSTVTGETTTLVPAQPGVTYEPVAWAPDGLRLALVRSEIDGRGLPTEQAVWVVNADGSQLQELVPAGSVWPRPLRWSPDGRWLALLLGPPEACAACRADGQDLAVVSADGGATLSVGPLVRGGWLSWAPDSSYLVAAIGEGRETYRNKRIVRFDVPSGAVTTLAGGPDSVGIQPEVSPDGRSVAFTAAPGLVGDPFTNLDAAHGYPKALIGGRCVAIASPTGDATAQALPTPNGWTDESPVWVSASALLFVRWRSDDGRAVAARELWLGSATGTGAVRLADSLGPSASAVGYYGELELSSLFSWHQ